MSENDQGSGIKADVDRNIHDFHMIMGGFLWNSSSEWGTSILELFLTEDYPVTTPKIHFMDRICHPNVDKLGGICSDILEDKLPLASEISRGLFPIEMLQQMMQGHGK